MNRVKQKLQKITHDYLKQKCIQQRFENFRILTKPSIYERSVKMFRYTKIQFNIKISTQEIFQIAIFQELSGRGRMVPSFYSPMIKEDNIFANGT